MDDSATEHDKLETFTRPDALREVDWVAVAPWLELLDTPRRACGYGLLIAAIGSVLLGGVPESRPAAVTDYTNLARATWDGVVSPITLVGNALATASGDERGWGDYWLGIARLAGWAWLGLVIADRAAVGIGDGRDHSLARSLWRSLRRLPRLAGVFGLFTAPLTLGVYWATPAAIHAGFGFSGSALALAALWGAVLVLALPATLLSIGFVVGSPLLWAAIAVDDADAFDAVSRMYAYVSQRLARLAFYLAVLAGCGFAFGVVVELLASATLAIANLGVPADLAETPRRFVGWWESVFVRTLRGFYPAYFFTAAVTLYLQLRRDIDGQPTDELGY